jgi:hypothetical protein
MRTVGESCAASRANSALVFLVTYVRMIFGVFAVRRRQAIFWVFSFACSVIPLPALAQGVQTNQAQTVHGTVINSLTREPIARALVYSPDNRFATFTDTQGHFEFQPSGQDAQPQGAVLPGTLSGDIGSFQTFSTFSGSTGAFHTFTGNTGAVSYGRGMLLARKPGFLVENNQDDEYLRPGGEVTLSLVPESLITGRVILPASDGATPIQLQLYKRQVQDGRAHWVPISDTTARSNGEFRFAELPPGIYKLFTLELMDQDPETFRPGGPLYGYPPMYFPTASSFASASTIHLSAGKISHADLSPIPQRYYPIKVPVANVAPGVPISVSVMVQGHRGPGFSLGYNDRDRAIEGMLPNGTYTLEAAAFGTPASSGVTSISVRDGPLESSPMMLVSNPSIRVNVRWELTSAENRNNPVVRQRRGRYVNVRLEPAEDFAAERSISQRNAMNATDDSLILEGVPPGRYWVRLDQALGFPVAVSSGGIDLLQHPLTVVAGSGAPIEITMRDDGAGIEGAVEGLSKSSPGNMGPTSYAPAAYLYCVPLPESTGQFTQVPVMQGGDFNFPNLSPGTYRLLAFRRPQPELEYRDPEAMRAYDSKGLVVRLVAGQKEHVRLPLVSSGE